MKTKKSKKTEMSTGIKHDQGKLPWELLPYDALREVVKVLRFGSSKYQARNWEKGFDYSRPLGAAMRHLFGDDNHKGWWHGDEVDMETKTSHLTNAVCELLFLLAFEVRRMKGLDNRPKL